MKNTGIAMKKCCIIPPAGACRILLRKSGWLDYIPSAQRIIKKSFADNRVLCLFCFIIFICSLFGCSGGFYGDNENAKEFLNPLFHPDKVDTTNIKSPG